MLRLRPPRPHDEAAVAAAHRAMAAEGFEFALGWDPAAPWADHLALLERQRCGIDLPPDRVPATFLLADVDGALVGRVSIRHQLNDFLAHEGGHIGYGVLVEHRRRGHATEILRQALVVARAVGVDRALVTCDDGNTASARVIERGGGVLEGVVASRVDGRAVRRYRVD